MLTFIERTKKARDAADRIMGYRIEEFNAKISKLLADSIREHLADDIAWLAKVKKMSTLDQFQSVRATTSVTILESKDDNHERSFMISTEYSYRRGWRNRNDAERAESFLGEPAVIIPLKALPFAVPTKAFSSHRDVPYAEAVSAPIRKKIEHLSQTEGAALIAEYKALVNNIETTLSASPNWSKLLVAWPDAGKFLPELEPAPKTKQLITLNAGLSEQIKKYQPPKKSKAA